MADSNTQNPPNPPQQALTRRPEIESIFNVVHGILSIWLLSLVYNSWSETPFYGTSVGYYGSFILSAINFAMNYVSLVIQPFNHGNNPQPLSLLDRCSLLSSFAATLFTFCTVIAVKLGAELIDRSSTSLLIEQLFRRA
jgi:hypothetical protein